MLTVKNLSFSYDPLGEGILKNISFHIKQGEYWCIIGDNGCGKSTLIKLILGLLKPISGSIFINRKNLAYVPQGLSGKREGFPITVREMLNAYRNLLHIKDKLEIDRALKAADALAYDSALVGNLSCGQMQKVLIARALIGNRPLLLLDEPSTGVDIKSSNEIYALLKKLNLEGMTIVSVEHNYSAVVNNATKILHLKDGGAHLCSKEKYAREKGLI